MPLTPPRRPQQRRNKKMLEAGCQRRQRREVFPDTRWDEQEATKCTDRPHSGKSSIREPWDWLKSKGEHMPLDDQDTEEGWTLAQNRHQPANKYRSGPSREQAVKEGPQVVAALVREGFPGSSTGAGALDASETQSMSGALPDNLPVTMQEVTPMISSEDSVVTISFS
ncbi:hypothetical protein NDU88_003807 [Pleurodeles waltl]|uniref:Uncharacterized protein n=1 Tax=Pleurodeles waltl TaxID=8319 RepID=A0AAV7KWL9_PLEWA|nr:hypothetical protein NDU88_003807 [Pleurodeles waltl]